MLWGRIRRRRALNTQRDLDCGAAAVLLQEYLDSELSDENSARVDAHLEICKKCGLSAETYTAIKDSLSRSQSPGDDVLDRLKEFAGQVPDRDSSGQ